MIGLVAGLVGLGGTIFGLDRAGVITVVSGTPSAVPSSTVTVTLAPEPQPAPKTSSSTATTTEPTVRRQGTIEFRDDNRTDFDAPPSDGQWGRANRAYGYDVMTASRRDSLVLDPSNNAQVADIGVVTADYDACSMSSAYSSQSIMVSELQAGEGICFTTAEGNYVGMNLIAADAESDSWSITVWEPPKSAIS